jgi:hypothetical protein
MACGAGNILNQTKTLAAAVILLLKSTIIFFIHQLARLPDLTCSVPASLFPNNPS